MTPPSPKGGARRVAVVTLGCPKNRVDSEVMLGALSRRGFEPVPDPSEADVIVVNTCGFIEDAKRESIDAILEAARLKRGSRRRVLAVAGCLAQRYGAELKREFPEVDVMVGLDDLERVAEILESPGPPPSGAARTLAGAGAARVLTGPTHSAYLKISDGCDMECAFCAIPAIRGRYRSRTLEDVLEEARGLAARGVRELNLVAQDTSGYGRDLYGRPKVPELLEGLSRVKGIEWIRLHYLDPARVTPELVSAVAETPKVCAYFDVPLQHVNGRILRSMKRVGNRANFEKMIAGIRRASPQAALRTTFIVGFPGETEEEFSELLSFVADTGFDHAGFFSYSREEGTAAALLPDPVEEAVRTERLNRASRLQEDTAPRAHARWIGRVELTVVEGVEDGRPYGRIPFQAPEVDGVTWIDDAADCSRGDWIMTEVTATMGQDLIARRWKNR